MACNLINGVELTDTGKNVNVACSKAAVGENGDYSGNVSGKAGDSGAGYVCILKSSAGLSNGKVITVNVENVACLKACDIVVLSNSIAVSTENEAVLGNLNAAEIGAFLSINGCLDIGADVNGINNVCALVGIPNENCKVEPLILFVKDLLKGVTHGPRSELYRACNVVEVTVNFNIAELGVSVYSNLSDEREGAVNNNFHLDVASYEIFVKAEVYPFSCVAASGEPIIGEIKLTNLKPAVAVDRSVEFNAGGRNNTGLVSRPHISAYRTDILNYSTEIDDGVGGAAGISTPVVGVTGSAGDTVNDVAVVSGVGGSIAAESAVNSNILAGGKSRNLFVGEVAGLAGDVNILVCTVINILESPEIYAGGVNSVGSGRKVVNGCVGEIESVSINLVANVEGEDTCVGSGVSISAVAEENEVTLAHCPSSILGSAGLLDSLNYESACIDIPANKDFSPPLEPVAANCSAGVVTVAVAEDNGIAVTAPAVSVDGANIDLLSLCIFIDHDIGNHEEHAVGHELKFPVLSDDLFLKYCVDGLDSVALVCESANLVKVSSVCGSINLDGGSSADSGSNLHSNLGDRLSRAKIEGCITGVGINIYSCKLRIVCIVIEGVPGSTVAEAAGGISNNAVVKRSVVLRNAFSCLDLIDPSSAEVYVVLNGNIRNSNVSTVLKLVEVKVACSPGGGGSLRVVVVVEAEVSAVVVRAGEDNAGVSDIIKLGNGDNNLNLITGLGNSSVYGVAVGLCIVSVESSRYVACSVGVRHKSGLESVGSVGYVHKVVVGNISFVVILDPDTGVGTCAVAVGSSSAGKGSIEFHAEIKILVINGCGVVELELIGIFDRSAAGLPSTVGVGRIPLVNPFVAGSVSKSYERKESGAAGNHHKNRKKSCDRLFESPVHSFLLIKIMISIRIYTEDTDFAFR